MSFWTRLKAGFWRSGALFAKGREYLPLAAGVALTLVAILIARHRIESVERNLRTKAAPVDVVVASRAIPKGTALGAQQLAKLSVPSSGTSRRNVPAREFELVLGARTKTAIEAGEPILWTDIEEPFDVETFSQTIPQGRRAVTIEADAGASCAGLIRPGDHVDICHQDAAGKTAPAWFYDIPVVAVDRHFDRPPDSEAAPDTSTLTILVTPDVGKRLAATRGGGLRWFLRNPDDRSGPQSPPARAAIATHPVEIWKAGVRESATRTAAVGVGE